MINSLNQNLSCRIVFDIFFLFGLFGQILLGNCSNHSDLSEEHLEAITRLFESNGELIEAWKSLWKGIFLLVLW